ncbi:MAG: transposase [Chlorobium sp.]|nr:transposase [Chlorobium sp.]
MRSKIKPMKKVAKMLRAHRSLPLNWFRAKNTIALGCVAGFNNKVKVVTKRFYGLRTHYRVKIALHYNLGDLPTPKATDRFCRSPSILHQQFPISRRTLFAISIGCTLSPQS